MLLSHTIHHELLILLDHCRAFRTPRCSLKTQSEANAPNPPNTHIYAHKLSLSVSYSHTLTETPRGQPRSWGTSPVRLYKCSLNLIDGSCMDQVTGGESGCGGKKQGLTIILRHVIITRAPKHSAPLYKIKIITIKHYFNWPSLRGSPFWCTRSESSLTAATYHLAWTWLIYDLHGPLKKNREGSVGAGTLPPVLINLIS